MRTILVILLTAILAGCASAPRVPLVSDTMWPETVVPAGKDQVRDRLLSAMASNGATIEQSTDSLIQARYRDPNAVLSQSFFGCTACTEPFIRTSIVLATVPDGTHVVVQYWRIIPKFGGAEQQMAVDVPQDYNRWQGILWNMRDEFAAQ